MAPRALFGEIIPSCTSKKYAIVCISIFRYLDCNKDVEKFILSPKNDTAVQGPHCNEQSKPPHPVTKTSLALTSIFWSQVTLVRVTSKSNRQARGKCEFCRKTKAGTAPSLVLFVQPQPIRRHEVNRNHSTVLVENKNGSRWAKPVSGISEGRFSREVHRLDQEEGPSAELGLGRSSLGCPSHGSCSGGCKLEV